MRQHFTSDWFQMRLSISIAVWKARGQWLKGIFPMLEKRAKKGLHNQSVLVLSTFVLSVAMFFNDIFEYGSLFSFDDSKEQMMKRCCQTFKL